MNNYIYIKIIRWIIGIVIFFSCYLIGLYNIVLKRINRINNAYSSLDVLLKQRYDLIPNLVKIVKSCSDYEKNTLDDLIKLRNELLKVKNKKELFSKNSFIENEINSIFLYAESYPKLKSNENFLNLQNELVEIENQISAARRTYNAHVTNYNNIIGIFPNNIFASLFKFKKIEWFVFEERNRKVSVDIYE